MMCYVHLFGILCGILVTILVIRHSLLALIKKNDFQIFFNNCQLYISRDVVTHDELRHYLTDYHVILTVYFAGLPKLG